MMLASGARGTIYCTVLRPAASHMPSRAFGRHAVIVRTKSKQDAKKSNTFVKLSAELSAASRACSGDLNDVSLSAAVAKAKAANMPKATVEGAIERGASGKGPTGESARYEGIMPGNVAVIVEALTDNRNRTGGAVRHAFTKHGGSLQADGASTWLFDRVGLLEVHMTIGAAKAGQDWGDALFGVALDAGAIDVELYDEGDDEPEGIDDGDNAAGDKGRDRARATVLCGATDLNFVRSALASGGFPAAVAELAWRPKGEESFSTLAPGSEEAAQFDDLLTALDANDDVQQVFHNARF